MIMKLCTFFNAISQKVVDPMKLTKLQDDLILMMCNLETIFPPLFFDLMPHLLIHNVHDMKYLGAMFLHQMCPCGRFMTVLKKYVHNQSHPEGCMVQGWATEEVIEFVVDYMDLQTIGKPISCHEECLSGKGTRGHTTFNVDYITYTQAYFTVLQQSVSVTPYVRMLVQMLRSSNPKKSEDWIAREHQNNFGRWLRLQIMDQDTCVQLVDTNPDDIEILQVLTSGPSTTIHRYTSYDINDYTFYARAQVNKKTNQSSGVQTDAYDCDGNRETYYGFIEEIWELEYRENLKVPLFHCQ
jgi:hypothetical protein